MADFRPFDNPELSLLLAGSFLIWLWVISHWARGRASLPLAEQGPVPWPALAVFATFLVAYFLPEFVTHFAAESIGPIKSITAVKWNVAASCLQVAVVVGLLAIAGPLRAADFGFSTREWRRDVLSGAGGFLASIAPVFLTMMAVHKLGWRGREDEHLLLKLLDADHGVTVVAWVALSAVVVAPIAEELIYRVLLQGWTQSQIAPAKAIVFSSVIFCLSHRLADVLPLAPLALILGYVYHRRHSFLSVVVLHAAFNAMNLALAVLYRS
ncbi:MAG TPA: CPBP family intramembrane glutamic endopeptidase [Planctomycetaceae bacterium]|nr:CPBP family intramembrane glutamic endopeptidase [Planctomycetaceae bacterium]